MSEPDLTPIGPAWRHRAQQLLQRREQADRLESFATGAEAVQLLRAMLAEPDRSIGWREGPFLGTVIGQQYALYCQQLNGNAPGFLQSPGSPVCLFGTPAEALRSVHRSDYRSAYRVVPVQLVADWKPRITGWVREEIPRDAGDPVFVRGPVAPQSAGSRYEPVYAEPVVAPAGTESLAILPEDVRAALDALCIPRNEDEIDATAMLADVSLAQRVRLYLLRAHQVAALNAPSRLLAPVEKLLQHMDTHPRGETQFERDLIALQTMVEVERGLAESHLDWTVICNAAHRHAQQVDPWAAGRLRSALRAILEAAFGLHLVALRGPEGLRVPEGFDWATACWAAHRRGQLSDRDAIDRLQPKLRIILEAAALAAAASSGP